MFAALFPEEALRESVPEVTAVRLWSLSKACWVGNQLSKGSRKQKLISHTPLHSLTNITKCQIIAGTNG